MKNKVIEELVEENKIAIYNNKVTIKNSSKIFNNMIYKLLKNSNNLNKTILAEKIPNIKPKLENIKSKIEKIEYLIKHELLIENNSEIIMTESFEKMYEGDSL